MQLCNVCIRVQLLHITQFSRFHTIVKMGYHLRGAPAHILHELAMVTERLREYGSAECISTLLHVIALITSKLNKRLIRHFAVRILPVSFLKAEYSEKM